MPDIDCAEAIGRLSDHLIRAAYAPAGQPASGAMTALYELIAGKLQSVPPGGEVLNQLLRRPDDQGMQAIARATLEQAAAGDENFRTAFGTCPARDSRRRA